MPRGKTISEIDGLIMHGDRIIIPQLLRADILKSLHSSRMGKSKTRARANNIIFWPMMSSQIETVIRSCAIYNTYRNSTPHEPLITHEILALSWMKLGIDIHTYGGNDYLLIVDYFSKFRK